MPGLRSLLALSLLLTGCLNHFVYHPKDDPPGVTTWSEQAVRGKLLLRLEWAKPDRPAEPGRPFPAVLVHPEAGHTAGEMRGVIKDLARAGYLALAADYRRQQGGIYRDTLRQTKPSPGRPPWGPLSQVSKSVTG